MVIEDDDLHAELAMRDENLCRSNRSPSLESKWTDRRKTIYELLHPEAKVGAGTGGRSAKTKDDFAKVAKSNSEPAPRFTADTAKRTGKAERTVQRAAERGKKIKRPKAKRPRS